MLAESVGQAMGVLRKALELDVSFDPQTSTRTFHLVMTDVAELIFLPQLLRHLGQIAPGVSVHSIQMPRERYRDVLERGEIDLALGQLPEMQRGFHQQHLFEEPLVCLMREDHPLSRRALTLQSFLSAGQVAVAPPALVDTLVKRALGKRAARRRIVLQVPHYMVVPMVIAESELIAVMPQERGGGLRAGTAADDGADPVPHRAGAGAPVLARALASRSRPSLVPRRGGVALHAASRRPGMTTRALAVMAQ